MHTFRFLTRTYLTFVPWYFLRKYNFERYLSDTAPGCDLTATETSTRKLTTQAIGVQISQNADMTYAVFKKTPVLKSFAQAAVEVPCTRLLICMPADRKVSLYASRP